MKTILWSLILFLSLIPVSMATYIDGEILEGLEIPDGDFEGDAISDGERHEPFFENGDTRDPFLDEDHSFLDNVQETTQEPREFVDHARTIAGEEDSGLIERAKGDYKKAEQEKVTRALAIDGVGGFADMVKSWADPETVKDANTEGTNEGSTFLTGPDAPESQTDPAPSDFTPTDAVDLGDGDAIL